MKRATAVIILKVVLLLLVMVYGGEQLWAQGVFLFSKNPDFSTDDRIFTRNDIMYMKVVAPEIDFTDLDKNEFELKADEGGGKFEGKFDNLWNGTYVASLDLSSADPEEDDWEWKVRISDEGGREFRAEVEIKIANGGNGDRVVEFIGKIDFLGQESILVNGITILLNNTTDIFDKDNQPINLSDLTVGDLVEIRIEIDANGNFFAIRIRIRGGLGDEIEIKGRIFSVGEDHLVVLGITFFVDENTEILNEDNEPITFGELKVGQVVEIKALVQLNRTFLATRIKIEDEDGDDEIEFTGRINALVGNTIIVEGVVFLVTNDTEILDKDNNPISFSDLEIGDIVEIRGEHGKDGILRATRIKVEEEFDDDEIEITGPVTGVGENEIAVFGLTFQVNNDTQILDEENRAIALSDIQIGFIVEVRADVLSDGTLLATKIKIEDRLGNVIEITGIITEVREESILVFGVEFLVTNETEILDEDNNPIELSDLQRGTVVEIRAEVQVDRTIIATRIKVEDRFRFRVKLSGTIEAIDGESVRISGILFQIDGNTEILDQEGNAIALGDLKVGQIVEVEAKLQLDGTLLATRIKILERIEDEVEVTGVIEQITSDFITVLGRTFRLTDNTVIFDANENIITISMLFVGQTVEVRGDLLSDDALIAIRIKIEDRDARAIDVVGPIDSFGSSTLEVVGIVFFVTDTTTILGQGGNSIGLSDLKVGQTVEMIAQGQPNGTRVATTIQVTDVLLLSGTVENVVFNGIEMLGKRVLFDANTLILGKENKLLSVDSLSEGQFVEVRAKENGDNVIFGTKVKIQGTSLVTSVSQSPEDPLQPDEFVLLQNYPNPFNPSTTITFTLPGSARLVNTKLTIFNLLGQAVRTLVDQPLSSGNHQRQWNGRDDQGNALPTGIYLYQLKAGNTTKTQRMLLLK